MTLWGTGYPKREFTYSGDLAKIIVKLLRTKRNEIGMKAINIGSGESISVNEIINILSEIKKWQMA